jgi:hypothetical protein
MSSVKETGSDDHAFWRLVIESQAGSGLSIKSFCENEGINPSSFYQWRKKLEQKTDAAVKSDDQPLDDSAVSVDPGFIPLGQIRTEPQELCIAFPSGIQVHASSHCDVKLLCETVRILCEQQC